MKINNPDFYVGLNLRDGNKGGSEHNYREDLIKWSGMLIFQQKEGF